MPWLSRPLLRVLFLVGGISVVLLLWSLGHINGADGWWDASTSAELGHGVRQRRPPKFDQSRGPPSNAEAPPPKWLEYLEGMPQHTAHPSLPKSRLFPNTSRPIAHPGVSRVLKLGTTDEYETGPLPSLDQAFDNLIPRLNAIKDATPEVPREHDFASPVFPPFLTDTLKERYAHLQQAWDEDGWVPGTEKRYYLCAIVRQVAGMLPDWFAAWTVLADFLGPESLSFAIHEGGSDDGSAELFKWAMRDHLLYIGVPPENIHVVTHIPAPDWEKGHRIELLAQMRNAVMQPFYDTVETGNAPDGKPWSAVIWYNDVYWGASHVLELLHHHFANDADMSCGWDHAGKWFYDGWVGRDMSGDLYTPFPVPPEDEDKPQKLFMSHPPTLARHLKMLPYQVFSGWNGMAVMNPVPFFPPYNVRFRRGIPRRPDQREGEEECQASESQFISLDFWKYGFGRIQTVPGVHLTYGKGDARIRGWLEFPRPDLPGEGNMKENFTWDENPPKKHRCHDWPDKLGKGYWAWDGVRWVDPPALEIPDPKTPAPTESWTPPVES